MEPLEGRLLLDADPLTLPRVIDDGDAGFATTGDWAVTVGAGHADDLRTIAGGDGTATWTVTGLCPGYHYRVSTTWTPAADRTEDASYTIVATLNAATVEPADRAEARTLAVAHVDQRTAPDDRSADGTAWEDLDVVLVRGNTLSVTLDGGLDGLLVADGLRVERLGSWQPPVGVPTPEFGLAESHWMYAEPGRTFDYGGGPEAYRLGADGPYTHYIDNTHPNATDTANPFGTPETPRLTIPRGLPAGSVVEVHGGPYTTATGYGRLYLDGTGTADAPLFIRGAAGGERPRIEVNTAAGYYVTETRYLILENLSFHRLELLSHVDSVVVRRCEFAGDLTSGGIGVYQPTGAPPEATITNIVIYDTLFHDNGDWQADFDQDVHGVSVARYGISSLWVVDNEFYHHSGDAVQINANHLDDRDSTHHLYVSRNLAHHNKQDAFWTKQATDVIFSENIVYATRPATGYSATLGGGIGVQYSPDRVWILHNEIYDCEYGIRASTDGGQGGIGDSHVYIIGNVLHNIHRTTGTDSGVWKAGAAVFIASEYSHRYILNNTIHDVDVGISVPRRASVIIRNNILWDVAEEHIWLEYPDALATSALDHTLFDTPARIYWGRAADRQVRDLASFQATYADQGDGCLEADPRFVDPAGGDLRLNWPTDPSPAVDAGAAIDAYVDLFESLYGLDIAVDFDGVARPQRDGIDLGAFEASNAAPVAGDDEATTAEDTTALLGAALLANDTDVEGDPLSILSVSPPAHGSATRMDARTVAYTPPADWYGTDSFTYTVSDGAGGTDTATVTVIVTPVNDDPAGGDDDAVTPEDTPVTIDVLDNDTDVDSAELTLTSFSAPSHGTVLETADGRLRYTPDDDWHGADSFTYTLSDGDGGTDTATVTVTVTSVNDDPVAGDDDAVTPEDAPVTIDVLDNDTDVDSAELTLTSFSSPAHGTVVETADGRLRYTPDADWHGADSFTYTVGDGDGGTDTATVAVTVTSVNDAPVARGDDDATPEDTPVTIDVLDNDTDVDSAELTLTSFSAPAHGTVLETTDGRLRYTPDADWHGADSFTYTVSDGDGGTDTATVTVLVTSVNDAPRAVDDLVATDEDAPAVVHPLLNDDDDDGDTLSVVAFAQPSHGTVTQVGTGRLIYMPAADWYGTDSFTYTVGDGAGGTDTGTVTVEVAEAPHMMTLDDRGQATFTDAAGNTVAVTLRGPGEGQLYFPDAGDSDLRRLVLRGTTGQSSLLVTSRGPQRHTTIGEVSIDGSLYAFVGWDVDLLGDLTVFGSLGRLSLDDVHDARITVGEDDTFSPLLDVSLATVTDTSLVSAVPIRTLTADDWLDTDGVTDSVEAPWLGSLVVRGQPGGALFGAADGRGDFDAAITLSGADGRGTSLGRCFVAGRLASDITATGAVQAIRAAQWDTGSLTAATAGTLILRAGRAGDALDGTLAVDLTLTGADRRGTSLGRLLVSGAVNDADIRLAGGANVLSASQWNSGAVTAETVNLLVARGVFGSGVLRGDFLTGLDLTGADRRGLSLGRLSISGRLAADLLAAGGVGAVQAAQWDAGSLQATTLGSLVLAGSPVDEDLTGDLSAVIDLGGTFGRGGLSLGRMAVGGAVTDADITLAGGAATVAASQWNGGALTAETIGSLAVRGRWDSQTLRGDFSGTLTLTGAHPRTGLSLARFLATGTVTGDLADGVGDAAAETISLAGGLGAVVAGEWHVGSLSATTIQRFTVRPTMWSGGEVTGSFSGALTLSGRAGAGVSLGALAVTGALQDATIRTAGSIGALAAGAILHSDILAGCNGGVGRHAAAPDDFADADAMIRSVVVRGVAMPALGAIDSFFRDSNLSAVRFGTVRLANPDLPNDTDFGLWARHAGHREIGTFLCTDSRTGDRWLWRPGRSTSTGTAFREENLVVYLL